MASGLTGSARLASANQAANRRNGSSASVKSPPVNHAGCSMGAASDILGVPSARVRAIGKRAAGLNIVERRRLRLCRPVAGCGAHCGDRVRACRCRLLVPAGLAGFPRRYRRDADRLDRAGRPTVQAPSPSAPARPKRTSPMRARPPPTCSPAAAKTRACRGKIRRPAPAAISRRSPPPIARTAIRAAIFSPAMCMGRSQDWLQGAACRSSTGGLGSEAPEAAQTELKPGYHPSNFEPIRLLHCVTGRIYSHIVTMGTLGRRGRPEN